jgi:hypothetical protein
MRFHRQLTSRRLRGAAGAAILALLPASAGAQSYDGYTFFRAVDGRAELIAADSGDRTEVEANYPVITGDRLVLDRGARADLLLSDGSQLSVDEVTDVTFDAVAESPDADQDQTVLRLYEGRILVASRGVWRNGAEAAIVDTANARIYLQDNGTYLVTADEARWTEVVVREGFAEVVDQNGSSVVRAGERLEVRGAQDPRTRVEPAGGFTSLEDFADQQEVIAARASDPRLDEPLYGTAGLRDQGDWVVIDSRQAWRPNVTVREWRPYWRGRWAHTPGGLYWVSYDPWSPVVYHYGAWDYHAAYGWVWYPGRVFSPGHVYWYWGPSYAGWVPRGYYDHFYGRHYAGLDFGFRFGIFGHVGGSFHHFDRWTFCPVGRFGYRGYSHYVDARWLGGRGYRGLERGYLLTDTRHLTRDRWHRPELVQVALDRGWRAERGLPERGPAAVPDVTPFVERTGRLSPETERQVLVKGRQAPRTDDPFASRVAVARSRRDGGDPSALGVRVDPRRATTSRGNAPVDRAASARSSDRQSPRAITERPSRGDAAATTNRSVARRPTVGGSSSAAPSTRQAPARRVLDGIRSRSGGADRSAVAPSRPSSVRPPTTSASGRQPVRVSPGGSSSGPIVRRPATTPPSRSTVRSTTPPSTRSTTTPRSTTPRSTTPPSTTRSTPPPSRSTVRSTAPPGRTTSPSAAAPRTTTRSTPPPSRSTVRSTAPPGRTTSPSAAAPRTTTRSTPPPSRSTVRSTAPPSRTTSRSTTAPRSTTRSQPPSSSANVSRSAGSGGSRAAASSGQRGSSRSAATSRSGSNRTRSNGSKPPGGTP